MLKIRFSSETHFSSKVPTEGMSHCPAGIFIAATRKLREERCNLHPLLGGKGLIALPKFVQ